MKSHFIKGTNQQYSIREDGKLIRNYSFSKDGKRNKIHKEVLVKVRLTNDIVYYSVPGRQGALHNLVADYFNIENQYKHIGFNHLKIIHIDGNPLNCSIYNLKIVPRKSVVIFDSKLSDKEKDSIYSRINYQKNSDKIKQTVRKYRENNKSLISKRNKIYRENNSAVLKKKAKLERERIDKAYVASKLSISVHDLTEQLYQDYKTTLLFKRKVAEKHNISIQSLK